MALPVALLLAGLVLGACGTTSLASAMRSWVAQSSFRTSVPILISDAHHAASALRSSTSSSNDLHTVCAVLLVETEQANASLLTPDHQASSLLSRAYTNFGAGAHECYGAGASAPQRTKALASLATGMAALSEATARIDVASGSSP